MKYKGGFPNARQSERPLFPHAERFYPDEIRYMLNLAADLKGEKRAASAATCSPARTSSCWFERPPPAPSAARLGVAAYDEGANVTFLDSKSPRWARRNDGRHRPVLGRFYDGIEYRGYDQKVVEGLAANAGVPVWNGLTDVDHPPQALADILTLMENTKKPLSKCEARFLRRHAQQRCTASCTSAPSSASLCRLGPEGRLLRG